MARWRRSQAHNASTSSRAAGASTMHSVCTSSTPASNASLCANDHKQGMAHGTLIHVISCRGWQGSPTTMDLNVVLLPDLHTDTGFLG
jgi:hypothetical protein